MAWRRVEKVRLHAGHAQSAPTYWRHVDLILWLMRSCRLQARRAKAERAVLALVQTGRGGRLWLDRACRRVNGGLRHAEKLYGFFPRGSMLRDQHMPRLEVLLGVEQISKLAW